MLPNSVYVDIMTSPLVMSYCGANIVPIRMKTGKLKRILFSAEKGHKDITPEILKQLPEAMADPVAITPSNTNPGSFVIITELKSDTGMNVTVPIELVGTHNGNYEANIALSVYTRTNRETGQVHPEWYQGVFEGWANSYPKNNDVMYYANEKKITSWYADTRLKLPSTAYHTSDFFNASIPNENDLHKMKSENPGFYQTAWHGSPYDFEHFDLGAMGSGEGRQVHGWGLYFAKDRKISEGYKDFLKNLRSTVVIDGKKFVGYKNGFRDEDGNRPSDKKLRFALLNLSLEGSREKAIQRVSELARTSKGTGFEEDYAGALKILKDSQTASVERPEAKLYEVDIPDNDVLLDEDKFLQDQPKKVKKAIADYYRSRPDSYSAPEDDSLKGSTTTGESFYKDVVFQMKREGSTNPKRDASLLLNSLGIKGVTYEGNKDGRCFVVFDDKAISIIDKYNQQQAQIQGQTTVTGDMISLFDAADQSTFMHESAHWYLINMQKLALNENASRQFVEDFMTLQQWIGNKKLDADISVEQH